jgi:hypothetical protein
MRIGNAALLIGAGLLAAGCDARFGNGQDSTDSNGQTSAEGKAEEGQIAFSTPGFDVKMNVPLDRAETDDEGKILYPGSKVTGLYIAANPDSKSGSDGEVELRFATPDAPDKVAAWYRDPARAGDFAIGSEGREGSALLLTGTEKGEDNDFRLRLEAKGNGTDGRLVVRDRK